MTATTETRVEAVINALLTVCAGISGVHVLDGPENNTTDVNDCIAIGIGNPEAVFVRQQMVGWTDVYLETVNVVCSAWSWSGSVDFAARRARVVDIMGALRDALSADPRLGGVCERAYFGEDQRWVFGLEGEGGAVSIGFTIAAETYT